MSWALMEKKSISGRSCGVGKDTEIYKRDGLVWFTGALV